MSSFIVKEKRTALYRDRIFNQVSIHETERVDIIYGESEHRNSVSIKIMSIEYEKEEILSTRPCIYRSPGELACFYSWQGLDG